MKKNVKNKERETTTISESILIDFEIYGSSNGVFSLAHTQTKDLATGVGCSFLFFSLAFDYYEWTKHTTNQPNQQAVLEFFFLLLYWIQYEWLCFVCVCVCEEWEARYIFNIEQSLSLSGSLTPIINNNNNNK